MGKGAQILTLLIDGEPADAFPDVLVERRRVQIADSEGREQEIEHLYRRFTDPQLQGISIPRPLH